MYTDKTCLKPTFFKINGVQLPNASFISYNIYYLACRAYPILLSFSEFI